MFEPVMLKKLELGKNLLRLCLCSKRSALGVRLMKLKTILVILAWKLHAGNNILRISISKRIKIKEQTQFLQSGHNSHQIKTLNKVKIK